LGKNAGISVLLLAEMIIGAWASIGFPLSVLILILSFIFLRWWFGVRAVGWAWFYQTK
jgi:hypothetical protein